MRSNRLACAKELVDSVLASNHRLVVYRGPRRGGGLIPHDVEARGLGLQDFFSCKSHHVIAHIVVEDGERLSFCKMLDENPSMKSIVGLVNCGTSSSLFPRLFVPNKKNTHPVDIAEYGSMR